MKFNQKKSGSPTSQLYKLVCANPSRWSLAHRIQKPAVNDSHFKHAPAEEKHTYFSATECCGFGYYRLTRITFYTAAMAEAQRPKIGVGVVIHDGAGNIVMGERAGSHGAGTLFDTGRVATPSRWC
jgi:hypothetical protein